MAEQTISDEQLGAVLEASRDFAFQLMAEKGKLIPFGARAGADGDIEFMRVADEDSTVPLDQIYAETQKVLSGQARADEIVVSTCVAHVAIEGGIGEEGLERAIRIHVEAPNFSRFVFAPYEVVPAEGEGGLATLQPGKMVAQEADAVVFAAA